ncbi:MAG: hypothetical protein ACFE85_18860 [Candidatus Hodarchaeota archaeon]
MNQKFILKYLKLFSIGFIVVSFIEFIDIILLSIVIKMEINGDNLPLIEIFFNTGLLPIHGSFLWVFLIIIPCVFVAFGFILFRSARKDRHDINTLSKFILVIGLFLLLGSFIKISYMILLANTKLNLGSSIEFQQALYNPLITSFGGGAMWIFLYAVGFSYLISGLIFGGVGLKWILILEKENQIEP